MGSIKADYAKATLAARDEYTDAQIVLADMPKRRLNAANSASALTLCATCSLAASSHSSTMRAAGNSRACGARSTWRC